MTPTNLFDHQDRLGSLDQNVNLAVKVQTIHDALRDRFAFIQRIAAAVYDPATDTLKTFLHTGEERCPLTHYTAKLADVLEILAVEGGPYRLHHAVEHPGGRYDVGPRARVRDRRFGEELERRIVEEVPFRNSRVVVGLAPLVDDPAVAVIRVLAKANIRDHHHVRNFRLDSCNRHLHDTVFRVRPAPHGILPVRNPEQDDRRNPEPVDRADLFVEPPQYFMSEQTAAERMTYAELKRYIHTAYYGHFADHFGDQLLGEAVIHDRLGLDPLGNIGVKTGGATGGSTLWEATKAVASGYSDCVLAMGWERMDEVPTDEGNFLISCAADKDWESPLGHIYTGYYAVMAQRYWQIFGKSEESFRKTLAEIAVKHHGYARFNPFAQSPMKITVDDVLKSPVVAYPLRALDCCLMSVGAACAILCDEDTAYKLSDHPMRLQIAGGTHGSRSATSPLMTTVCMGGKMPVRP